MDIRQLISASEQEPVTDALPPHLEDDSAMEVEQSVEASSDPQLTSEIEEYYEEDNSEMIATCLHLSGVNNLSTDQVRKYIDTHIKPGYSFNTREQYTNLKYSLYWINDAEINILFDSSRKENLEKIIREKDEVRERTETQLREATDLLDIIKSAPEKPLSGRPNGFDLSYGEESINGAAEAILLLTDFANIRKEHEEFAALSLEDQFTAVGQAPKLQDRKCWDLILTPDGKIIRTPGATQLYKDYNRIFKHNGIDIDAIEEEEQPQPQQPPEEQPSEEQPSEENPTEEKKIEETDANTIPEGSQIIKLEVRYSTNNDRKMKGSGKHSEYYKKHGVPRRIERIDSAREKRTDPDSIIAREESDLITHKRPETRGLFGYAHDRDEREIRSHRSRNYREVLYAGNKWKSDKFYNNGPSHRVNKLSRRGGNVSFNSYRKQQNFRQRNRPHHGDDNNYNNPGPDLFPDFGKK